MIDLFLDSAVADARPDSVIVPMERAFLAYVQSQNSRDCYVTGHRCGNACGCAGIVADFLRRMVTESGAVNGTTSRDPNLTDA